MGTLQETVKSDAASKHTVILAVPLPKAGERFSDEELRAKFGVPTHGGIRVSRENKCIVLVNRACDSTGYTDAGGGVGIMCMGEDSDRMGVQNQEMSDGNLALSRSKEEGYTVLHFIEEDGAATFVSRVEYDSHEFEPEISSGGRHRAVINFSLRKIVGGIPSGRKHSKYTEAAKEYRNEAARIVANERAETEAADSPPLTPEEIGAIGDFLSEQPLRTISKEEFLGIVMDDKKLEEHVRSLGPRESREIL